MLIAWHAPGRCAIVHFTGATPPASTNKPRRLCHEMGNPDRLWLPLRLRNHDVHRRPL